MHVPSAQLGRQGHVAAPVMLDILVCFQGMPPATCIHAIGGSVEVKPTMAFANCSEPNAVQTIACVTVAYVATGPTQEMAGLSSSGSRRLDAVG